MPATSVPTSIHYRIEIGDLHAHLFRITLTIAQPAAQQRVSLPVWIPGSYLIREFSKNLQRLCAYQGSRKPVKTIKAVKPDKADKGNLASNAPEVVQIDKCTWQINCTSDKPLTLTYEVYANDNSVRTAYLDPQRGFFNGTSLCLLVEGKQNIAHGLEIPTPEAATGCSDWSLATALPACQVNAAGFGEYVALNYDELVDCPVEMGRFWSGTFAARGVPHRFVVAGATATFDGTRLLDDTQKICETEIRFWHGNKKPPYKNYLFMLNAVDEGYGGLEHRNSTALICQRKDLPRVGDAKVSEGYTTLRGLISHEYFHTWNVKRLRPAELTHYDYSRENHTELLWFFEGFTSYYDDLLLRRAGLLDNASYLKLLNKTINQVMQTPGRLVQSVAQASFDAWVKYYRQDENTANATVSYYTKGSLVALCLDLMLRDEGRVAGSDLAGTTLDDVMRALWLRCKAGPLREADLAAELVVAGGRSFEPELMRWVHGTDELPLEALLLRHGVAVLNEPGQLAHRLGVRVSETQGVQIKTVLRGGVAESAGFAAGDEWLGVEPAINISKSKSKDGNKVSKSTQHDDGWRLSRLDDLLLYAGSAQKITALVARDKRLLRLQLTMPPELATWRLIVKDEKLLSQWLDAKA